MKKKQFRPLWLILAVSVLILLTTALSGQIRAKYVGQFSQQGTLTLQASLATEVIVQEHKAERQADGSYELVTQEYAERIMDDEYTVETFVTANTYTLIPGLDIPKDPHIIIKGKTPIEAFLFIEVSSTLDIPVQYTIDSQLWTALPNTPGVYYYKDPITQSNSANPIYILEGNRITVSQYLLSRADDNEDVLSFTVKLIEKAADSATPEQAYSGYPLT